MDDNEKRPTAPEEPQDAAETADGEKKKPIPLQFNIHEKEPILWGDFSDALKKIKAAKETGTEPDFTPAEKAAIDKFYPTLKSEETQKAIKEAREKMENQIASFLKKAATAFKAGQTIANIAQSFLNIRTEILGSIEVARDIAQGFKELAPDLTKEGLEKIEQLEPFLLMEIEAIPELDEISIFEIIKEGFTEDGEPLPDSKYKDLIDRAIDRCKSAKVVTSTVDTLEIMADTVAGLEKAENITQITAIHTDKVDYPLDKPNNVIWDLIEGTKFSPQLRLDTVTIDTSKGKKKHEAGVIYGISFDELTENNPNLSITRQLTQFDKRVYIAAAALYNAGNDVTTVTQIYKQMGNQKQPTAAQIDKINTSLTKMGGARIYINNTAEAGIYKKYSVFKYDASLLPFERITASINGGESETAIHFFREPPLMDFARSRKQITTLDLKLLASPISKTEANLAIDDYLLERISHIKKGKANPKILYDTLYKKCKITTKKQKQRAPKKIERYLKHYKSCNFICDYRLEADGIYIIVSDTKEDKKATRKKKKS